MEESSWVLRPVAVAVAVREVGGLLLETIARAGRPLSSPFSPAAAARGTHHEGNQTFVGRQALVLSQQPLEVGARAEHVSALRIVALDERGG